MATFNKQALLHNLSDRTEMLLNRLRSFSLLNDDEFNKQPAAGKWSIAEIFEHLNILHGIYLTKIREKIDLAALSDTEEFKSGWLGDWVYSRIMPRVDGRLIKMKSPRFLQAHHQRLNGKEVLEEYSNQLRLQLQIFDQCRQLRMDGIYIPFASPRLLKLRLGDNLRFLVAHSERHMMQAESILRLLKD